MSTSSLPARAPHPALFMLLIAPFGATSGFIGTCMGYWLHQAGVSTAAVTTLIALTYVPQTWKFLWAPLVDLMGTRRNWYLLGVSGVMLGMLAIGMMPMNTESLAILTALAVAINASATLVGMATENLMAHLTPPETLGRTAGWFQAGNLGGSGLGGGLALWLSTSGGFSHEVACVVLALTCLACAAPLLRMQEPEMAKHESAWHGVKAVAQDFWSLARSRAGALAMLVCFLPLGTGAMNSLHPLLADEWHASADTVALVTGTLAGILSAIGCMIGGWICDRIDRKLAYCLGGLVIALVSIAMAYGPRTESAFILLTSCYAVLNGICYAAFTAVTLEVIGKGAAATKYTVMASLSNTPIGLSTKLYGDLQTSQGTQVALLSEMGLAIPSVLLFALVVGLTHKLGRRKAATETPAQA